MKLHYKDLDLITIGNTYNIAQFISVSPDNEIRYKCINGYSDDHHFVTIRSAVEALLSKSAYKSINIRTFIPDDSQSKDFVPSLKTVDDVCANIDRLIAKGLYLIIHEAIDLLDGGVSGIAQNNIIEFSPGNTPRFVEKSDEMIEALPIELGLRMLEIVYGFKIDIPDSTDKRVEFSIHPKPVGNKHSHVIIWEEHSSSDVLEHRYVWPTAFSKFIGDKTYGLLMAHLVGIHIPYTTVFSRNPHLGIFSFGMPTGSSEVWMRTCPSIQEPGTYITVRGWMDPYTLMKSDDPDGKCLVSCLAQQEVESVFSGALISTTDDLMIEGVKGFGDAFMLGEVHGVDIPAEVLIKVSGLYDRLEILFGKVRFEWSFDGYHVWLMQLHIGVTKSSGRIIYPGEYTNTVVFNTGDDISKLYNILNTINDNTCVLVNGEIGMTSHIADILRKHKRVSRLT